MIKKNILVFPCGSEIGLEIHRSLENDIHFELYGANSVEDHGRFVYDNYIGDIPYIESENFIDKLNKVIIDYKIDLIYPTMDNVISFCANNRDKINCDIISSSADVTSICLSKKKTYEKISHIVPMPELLDIHKKKIVFPVFLKPEIGYSSRGTAKVNSIEELNNHFIKYPTCLIMEYLPGEEYTIDCFCDKNDSLIFVGVRKRKRISNGISVASVETTGKLEEILKQYAHKIHSVLKFRGAWFFQVKLTEDSVPKVMEVAARLGGSSAFFRAKGVNFACLSVWTALNVSVEVLLNDFTVEMDRALDNQIRMKIDYDTVYIDFDDTLFINGKINTNAIQFLFQSLNNDKKIICITRHKGDIINKLKRLRIYDLFDEIIHLKNNESKSLYIQGNSIFIDDSFRERKDVLLKNKIPVFSTDIIKNIKLWTKK